LALAKGLGEEFVEKTKYRYLRQSDQDRGILQPPLELPYDESRPTIDLPPPDKICLEGIALRKAIESRHSVRGYSDSPLTIEELSFLLWCTQGVKKVIIVRNDRSRGNRTKRTVPSAGARHPFETFLAVRRVEGIGPGLYRFLAIEHKLMEIDPDPSIATKVAKCSLDQMFMAKSAVIFIWVAVPYRVVWRYGERGYRYLSLDAGHICQNLYLASEAIGAGACAVGAYDDNKLNGLLGLDGTNQFVLYLAPVGKKRPR
jgi:SagB-type dehydrogenase family enzyme